MINERPALVVLQTTSENNMEHLSYNHGQKSWDKFTFVALFHTRQTNSHARIIYPCSAPPPPISLECWKRVRAISLEFQHCIGCSGGEGGGEATYFATDNSAFLKLRFKSTDN